MNPSKLTEDLDDSSDDTDDVDSDEEALDE